MRRRVRLAVLGESPCDLCHAACCKQNGHAYAILLEGEEVRRFSPWAVSVSVETEVRVVSERVVPYREGRCPFLGDSDRCTLFSDRGGACRRFLCVGSFTGGGVGRHGRFLELNPRVVAVLEGL